MAKNLSQRVHDTVRAHPDGLTLDQIAGEMGESRSKVSSALYNLVHRHTSEKGVIQHPPGGPRSEAMFYPLGHGPTAEGLTTESSVKPAAAGAPAPAETTVAPAAVASERAAPVASDASQPATSEVERTPLLGDKEKFELTLGNLGVKAGPILTIAETFFETGDHDDLRHLWDILHNARAFVTAGQRRTIMKMWASYVERDIPEDVAKLLEQAPSEQAGEGGDSETVGIDEFGLGWRVEKDESGEWVPAAGGEIKTHLQALKAAAGMNSASSKGKRVEGEVGDIDEFGLGWRVEKDESGEWVPVSAGEIKTHMQALRAAAAMNAASGKGNRAEGDGSRSGIDPTVQVLIERAFPDDRKPETDVLDQVGKIVDMVVPKRPEGEEGEVARLRRELQEEKEKARDKEIGELKGLVVASLNRDPVDDYIKMQERMGALQGSPVTDNSPTVQVIKDQTDKLERLGARGLGLVERVVMRNQPLEPEEGSEVDQEQRAEGLADRLEGDSRQRQLRREIYGV